MIEDKRGTKRSRSPSKEGSSSPSGSSMPPLALSTSPPRPGSPSEVFSRHPCSLVFEQGGPFEKVLVVDLSSSSDEDSLIPNTSRDEEFIKRIFGELNYDVLGLSGDDKIIILNDSNDEEEEEDVHEEDATDAEAAPSSVVRSLAPSASTDDTDKGDTPDRVIGGSSSGGDEAGLP
jgi:hypothetical protein